MKGIERYSICASSHFGLIPQCWVTAPFPCAGRLGLLCEYLILRMGQKRKAHLMQLEWQPGFEGGKYLAGKVAAVLKVKGKRSAEAEWDT